MSKGGNELFAKIDTIFFFFLFSQYSFQLERIHLARFGFLFLFVLFFAQIFAPIDIFVVNGIGFQIMVKKTTNVKHW